MKAVPEFVSNAWLFLVRFPLGLLWSVLKLAAFGWLGNIVGRGYKPRNDLLDQVYKDCVELPVGQGVRLPWAGSDTPALTASGRLYAYVAIANKWFGLAEKVTGEGGDAKRSYRYYYRADMAGNWFAEIWSVWKSGFWAALLALPFMEMAAHVNRVDDAWKGRPLGGHEGALLLVSGLLLVFFFLPRAIFGRGTHLVATSLIGGGSGGGGFSYGCAQLINWAAGLGGISFIWLALGLEWNFVASAKYVIEFLYGFLSYPSFSAFLHDFYSIPVVLAVLSVAGMAWIIIPAAAFWYVSLRYHAVRQALAQLEATSYSANQASLYDNSEFQADAGLVAPQIGLAYIIYCVACVAFLLHPVAKSVIGLFW
jgi:hypothetical protein